MPSFTFLAWIIVLVMLPLSGPSFLGNAAAFGSTAERLACAAEVNAAESPKPPLRLLLIGFDENPPTFVRAFSEAGYASTSLTVRSSDELNAALNSGVAWDIILADPFAKNFNGRDALRQLAKARRALAPALRYISVVLVTKTVRPETAARWMRLGATDVVHADRPSNLVPATFRAIRRTQVLVRRREAKDSVEEENIRHRSFATHPNIESFVLDEHGRYVFGNESFARRVQSVDNAFIGTHWQASLPPAEPGTPIGDFIARNVSENREVFATGVPTQRVDVLPDQHGNIRNWLSTKFRFQGLNGKYYLGGISINLGELEPAVRKAEELATLLDIAHDAIYSRNIEGKVRFWNHGAERLYGWTSAEMVGRENADLLFSPDNGRDEAATALAAVLAEGKWFGQLHHRTKAGKPVVVESHWTLVRNFDGSPRDIFIVNRDITEKLHRELRLQLGQRMEAIGRLVSGVAHDFNNLLTPILVGTQLMLVGKVAPGEQIEMLESMKISAERAAEIVRSLLLFSRGVEGKKGPMNIAPVVEEAARLVTPSLPKNMAVRTILPPAEEPLWSVDGDSAQLSRALMNLFVNARDAMKDGGVITVHAANMLMSSQQASLIPEARPGRYVVITVADTGTGVPQAIQHLLFVPFFSTKDPSEGTGLGLSNVYGILKWHGGFVNFYSEEGIGTKFLLYLPAEEPKSQERRLLAASELAIPRGQGELILVVDDEPALRQLASLTLKTYGYQTVTAENGAQALTIYAENRDRIAAVLMDVNMPVLGGVEALRSLRKVKPTLPVILVSGLPQPTELVESTDPLDQLQGFLSKPYQAAALMRLLRQAIVAK